MAQSRHGEFHMFDAALTMLRLRMLWLYVMRAMTTYMYSPRGAVSKHKNSAATTVAQETERVDPRFAGA